MTVPSVAENVASRFKLMDRPHLSPGKCAVCGSVHRAVLDFGLNLARYGAVMLCEDCVCEAAERFGMVRPSQLEAATLQTGQSVDEYLTLHNLKAVPNELYDAFSVALGVFSSVPLPAFSDHTDSSVGPVAEGTEEVRGQLQLVFADGESNDSESDGNVEAFDLGV